MAKVEKILEDAVREYNNTILGRNRTGHTNDSNIEKRGIFYNCLRRQFASQMGSFRFNRMLSAHHFACYFRENNSLEYFKYLGTVKGYGILDLDLEVLEEIQKHSGKYYLDTSTHISLDDIKNFTFKNP